MCLLLSDCWKEEGPGRGPNGCDQGRGYCRNLSKLLGRHSPAPKEPAMTGPGDRKRLMVKEDRGWRAHSLLLSGPQGRELPIGLCYPPSEEQKPHRPLGILTQGCPAQHLSGQDETLWRSREKGALPGNMLRHSGYQLTGLSK